MNYQRKLIRKVCVVGVSSALIASMGAMDPTTAFPEGHVLAAEVEEEKFWEDMTEEERMALPEEERERLKAEAEKRAEEVRLWESMTEEERMALPEEERERLRELAEKAMERGEGAGTEGQGPEDGSGTLDNPENSDPENETGNPENPGEEDVVGNPEDGVEGGESDDLENPNEEAEDGDMTDPKDPDGDDMNQDSEDTNEDDAGTDSVVSDGEAGIEDTAGTENMIVEDETGASEETEVSDGSAEADVSDISNDQADNAAEEILPGKISNEELISSQQIVKLPEIVENFHFWTVARKYAFAKEDIMIREQPLEEDADGDKVRFIGRIDSDGLLYILEEKDGWYYVESGKVRGFVKDKDVLTGDKADKLLKKYQKKARKQAKKTKSEYNGIESIAPMAEELVRFQENKAFTYLRATVNQTVIEKNYALSSDGEVEVKEDKSIDSRTVGIIPSGGLCYILEDKDQDWIYIESEDVRGFVEGQSIVSGKEVAKAVEEKGEQGYVFAKEAVKPEENMAYYYTLTSTQPGIPSGEIRKSMIEYAAQFIGNPYVWGGTSLTKGADCSGFVQSIYKQYGYELPRVACDQAQYGVKVPVEDALPGDLIFYAKDGYVHHVVMYAGEGKTIEAMSSNAGIVQADLKKGDAVWATRILDDNGYSIGNIGEVNATEDMYGLNLGKFKLTYYCSCELCCDVETGITATGAPVVEGRTIAVDPSVIPYGTQVIIGGHIFTAEDCGGAIKGNRIDVYVNSHQKALGLGVNYADVYLKK